MMRARARIITLIAFALAIMPTILMMSAEEHKPSPRRLTMPKGLAVQFTDKGIVPWDEPSVLPLAEQADRAALIGRRLMRLLPYAAWP